MRANNVLETIGNTPHVRINKMYPDSIEVWMKMERENPAGSIKDRIALSMIEDAERRGLLNKDSVIVEPTSGNTGIGLAMVAAVKGYKLILVMPDSMSVERRRLMKVFGAQLELTPREKGMPGCIEHAKKMAEKIPNSWMPLQFDNPANIQVHKMTTAQEILKDFPEGIDYLVTGVGTGGHITGVGEELKKRFPDLKVFAVEPELSAVISGGQPAPHPIQGIGAGFIPNTLHTDVLDGVIKVNADEAKEHARQAALKEGILIGISSGATLSALTKKLPDLKPNSRVLIFCYDTGERYLSVEDFF